MEILASWQARIMETLILDQVLLASAEQFYLKRNILGFT